MSKFPVEVPEMPERELNDRRLMRKEVVSPIQQLPRHKRKYVALLDGWEPDMDFLEQFKPFSGVRLVRWRELLSERLAGDFRVVSTDEFRRLILLSLEETRLLLGWSKQRFNDEFCVLSEMGYAYAQSGRDRIGALRAFVFRDKLLFDYPTERAYRRYDLVTRELKRRVIKLAELYPSNKSLGRKLKSPPPFVTRFVKYDNYTHIKSLEVLGRVLNGCDVTLADMAPAKIKYDKG